MERPYAQLPVKRGEIRLLYLHPGQGDDELTSEVKVTTENTIPYEAVSYTWGAAAEHHRIRVNEFLLPVTDNLWYALRRFRTQHAVRVLWVDAVCIDQQNIRERERQVSHMFEIYRQATQVLIWLGESEKSLWTTAGADMESTNQQDHDCKDEGGQIVPATTKAAYFALDNVLRWTVPVWIDRVWTVQEALANTRFTVQFGPHRLSWDEDIQFAGLVKWIDDWQFAQYQLDPSFDDERMRIFEQTQRLKYLATARSKGDHRFSHLADIIVRRNSHDKRDRVYSLLGLMNPASAALAQPDYDMPPAKVFAKATFALLSGESNFEFLRFINHGRPRDVDLPSWVVDFTNTEVPRTPFGRYKNTPGRIGLSSLHLSDDFSQLTVEGISLGSIDGCVDIPSDNAMLFDAPPSEPLKGLLLSALDRTPTPFLAGARAEMITKGHIALGRTQTPAHESESPAVCCFDYIIDILQKWSIFAGIPGDFASDKPRWPDQSVRDIRWYAEDCAGDPKMFTTYDGLLGLAPGTAQQNDIIVMCPGGKRPILIRPDDEYFKFCGFCYVQGTVNPNMEGEMLDCWFDAGIPLRRFVLL